MNRDELNDSRASNIKMLRFFQNPAVGILGSLASIASLIVAIYFYHQTKVYPQLTYSINKSATTVYKAGEATSIKILHNNKEIRNNVFAVQMIVWNAGKKSIKPENILQPVRLRISKNANILEAKTLRRSRDVIGFSIDDTNKETGILTFSWDIMEKNDGAIVQLIYSADAESEFSMTAIIENQSEIKNVGVLDMTAEIQTQLWPGRTIAIIVLILYLVTFGLYTVVCFYNPQIEQRMLKQVILLRERNIVMKWLLPPPIYKIMYNKWVTLIIFVLIVIYLLSSYLYQLRTPPFYIDYLSWR